MWMRRRAVQSALAGEIPVEWLDNPFNNTESYDVEYDENGNILASIFPEEVQLVEPVAVLTTDVAAPTTVSTPRQTAALWLAAATQTALAL